MITRIDCKGIMLNQNIGTIQRNLLLTGCLSSKQALSVGCSVGCSVCLSVSSWRKTSPPSDRLVVRSAMQHETSMKHSVSGGNPEANILIQCPVKNSKQVLTKWHIIVYQCALSYLTHHPLILHHAQYCERQTRNRTSSSVGKKLIGCQSGYDKEGDRSHAGCNAGRQVKLI